MAHQDIAQTARIELRFFQGGELAENVMHAKAEDVITITEMDELAALFTTWLNDSWKPLASDQWSCAELIITDMTSVTGARKSYLTGGAPIAGLLAEDPLPSNATVAVKADVGIRGRGKNGRVFWIGLTDTQADGNRLVSAVGDDIVAAMEDLRTAVEGSVNWAGMAIPHLVVGGVRPPLAQSSLVLNYHLSDLTIDSQRDRLPGHRKHKKRTP